jgi:taurine dioxygenase
MAAGRLELKPLNPNCGSEIKGVDVNELTDAEVATVKAEVANQCVVIFPGQFISPKDQLALAKRFGEILLPGHTPTLEGAHGVMQLQSTFLNENPNYHTNTWHTDATHMPRPPSFTFLSCEQPAPLGGDTLWTNQYFAYETLSDGMKHIIRGLRLTFVAAEHYRIHRHPGDALEMCHPLVRVHAETRRKSLFINDYRLSSKIVGINEEEGRSLKDFLYRHSQQPEHAYRHRWQKGDLAIWDNRCSLHYAVRDYDPKATRTMNRIMIAGEAPIADTDET